MKILSTLKLILDVKKRYNKGVLSQAYEVFVLRCSRGKLGMSEYYDYGLFDDARYSLQQKKEFVGWRLRFILQNKLNKPGWNILSTDKLLYQMLMMQVGLPVPEIIAVYSNNGRYAGEIEVYNSAESLKSFFEKNEKYPIFLKPIHSWHGRGALGVQSYDKKINKLVLINGKVADIDQLIDTIQSEPEGYIFQKCLVQHEELVRRCGSRLSTVRIWVLLTENGPVVFRALWKVSVGDNMTDNTDHGRTGNFYGPVDVATGLVKRQILNAGFNEEEITRHPDTGAPIIGFVLPLWDSVKRTVLKASEVFPGLGIQPWDVAITPAGPVLVELSVPGDIDGPQFSEQRGLWDETLNGVLRRKRQ